MFFALCGGLLVEITKYTTQTPQSVPSSDQAPRLETCRCGLCCDVRGWELSETSEHPIVVIQPCRSSNLSTGKQICITYCSDAVCTKLSEDPHLACCGHLCTFRPSTHSSREHCHLSPQVKAVRVCALLLCAWWTAVSAMASPSLGHSRALAASGNGTLMAGQSLTQAWKHSAPLKPVWFAHAAPWMRPSCAQHWEFGGRITVLNKRVCGFGTQCQSLCSPDGTVCLIPQGDGNLVLCAPANTCRASAS